jgi:hypothetical protein
MAMTSFFAGSSEATGLVARPFTLVKALPGKPPGNWPVLQEMLEHAFAGMCSEEPPRRDRRARTFSLQMGKADARTRTGDPFITSDGPVSARVRPSHSGPLVMGDPTDWSGLGVTGEDNLVDGWWTAKRLSD